MGDDGLPSWDRIRANIERIVAQDEQRKARGYSNEVVVTHDPSITRPRAEPGAPDQAVIDVLKGAGIALSKRELIARSGVNPYTMSDVLARLRASDTIVKCGESSGTTYRLQFEAYEPSEPEQENGNGPSVDQDEDEMIASHVAEQEPEADPEPEAPDPEPEDLEVETPFGPAVPLTKAVIKDILHDTIIDAYGEFAAETEKRAWGLWLDYAERYLATLLDQLERVERNYSDFPHLTDRIERMLDQLKQFGFDG